MDALQSDILNWQIEFENNTPTCMRLMVFHLLYHLPEQMKDWGPLMAGGNNTMSYERYV